LLFDAPSEVTDARKTDSNASVGGGFLGGFRTQRTSAGLTIIEKPHRRERLSVLGIQPKAGGIPPLWP
jgi:hypothetical protein